MKLLFKRNQTAAQVGRVKFQLWAKVELNDDETEIVKRYNFDEAVLIRTDEPRLRRNAFIVGAVAAVVIYIIAETAMDSVAAFILALFAGCGAAYFYFDKKRETIFVRDLMHGRYFSCPSIIDLARKESYLNYVTSFLRQVMESAKHWDGTETFDVEALPKDEAKLVMIRGL